MDPEVLRDIPPSCPKQSLGLVLLASPFLPRRSWTNFWQTTPFRHQVNTCSLCHAKLPASKILETPETVELWIMKEPAPRSRGVWGGSAHAQPPQTASTMHYIPWEPFSPHFPLTSPGWQHWDSPGTALAEGSSFLALLSFFFHE